MKLRYKYIHFKEESFSENPKEQYWVIYNNKTKDQIGHIEWYPRWKEWVFAGMWYDTRDYAIFNTSCLTDIIDFIKQLKKNNQ